MRYDCEHLTLMTSISQASNPSKAVTLRANIVIFVHPPLYHDDTDGSLTMSGTNDFPDLPYANRNYGQNFPVVCVSRVSHG